MVLKKTVVASQVVSIPAVSPHVLVRNPNDDGVGAAMGGVEANVGGVGTNFGCVETNVHGVETNVDGVGTHSDHVEAF